VTALRECPLLEFVSLWKSVETDAPARTALTLPRICHLDLGGSGVSDALFVKVEPNPSLRVLRLDHTEISDACVSELSRWSNLRVLDVAVTNLSEDGLQRLRDALPNCLIVTDPLR
jgi:hypothetical protein